MSTTIDKYISVDEDGYFAFDAQRVDDETYGRKLQENLAADDKGRYTTELQGNKAWVEYFDAPLIAKHIALKNSTTAVIDLAYNNKAEAGFDHLCVDEWDRFHGLTTGGIAFVLSRQAQVEFFELLDEFDDDSVTIGGRKYSTPAWLEPFRDADKDQFWTKIYQTEEPGWELNGPTPVLKDILPQLKLSKSKVLVLGCGSGHDAAFLADAGHVVTAVDFSTEAIERAKKLYGSKENLTIIQADAFNLPAAWSGTFDLVLEHTCYCAVAPDRRNELVKVWRRMLNAHGHLLGIFFSMEKRRGPPFGGSEWEIRQRLRDGFQFLYWTRWHHSIENRRGREVVIYARKKS